MEDVRDAEFVDRPLTDESAKEDRRVGRWELVRSRLERFVLRLRETVHRAGHDRCAKT
jgi:hypothetical protein